MTFVSPKFLFLLLTLPIIIFLYIQTRKNHSYSVKHPRVSMSNVLKSRYYVKDIPFALIILALAAKANITETQNLLKYAGERPLYVRDRRDGLIFYAIEHGKDLDAVNILLDENNLEILK